MEITMNEFQYKLNMGGRSMKTLKQLGEQSIKEIEKDSDNLLGAIALIRLNPSANAMMDEKKVAALEDLLAANGRHISMLEKEIEGLGLPELNGLTVAEAQEVIDQYTHDV